MVLSNREHHMITRSSQQRGALFPSGLMILWSLRRWAYEFLLPLKGQDRLWRSPVATDLTERANEDGQLQPDIAAHLLSLERYLLGSRISFPAGFLQRPTQSRYAEHTPAIGDRTVLMEASTCMKDHHVRIG